MKGKQFINTICQKILLNYQATIKELAQSMGMTVFSSRAVPYSQMYYRELGKCKT